MQDDDGCKVFVGGVSWDSDNDSLRGYFEKFGKVDDAIIILDRETGRSRGFGFVTFSSPKEATDAIEAAPHEIDGRDVSIVFVYSLCMFGTITFLLVYVLSCLFNFGCIYMYIYM